MFGQLLTSDAVDHERVELLLAVLAQTRQIGARLRLAVKQVVEEGQGHLLGRAAVRVNVDQVTARTEQTTCIDIHIHVNGPYANTCAAKNYKFTK